ncbi:hypothetical protein [Sulfurovum sp.]|uniref:hypothetical protein n=1 Tax=Sulfurovum sp. TaxID=1969726 RepID=UPI003565C77F
MEDFKNHKGYMGFVTPEDDRWEKDIQHWKETGVAYSESWNMDKVILKLIAIRLACYDGKDINCACLGEVERQEISNIAKVFDEASEDYTGKVEYSKEWNRLGELLGGLWN